MTDEEILKSINASIDRMASMMMSFMRSINDDLESIKERWNDLEPEIRKAINWPDQPLTYPVPRSPIGPEKLDDEWIPPVGPYSSIIENDINTAMNDVLNSLAVRYEKHQD